MKLGPCPRCGWRLWVTPGNVLQCEKCGLPYDQEKIDFGTLCDQTIDKWGMNHQLMIAVEEMSELTKEICKILRYSIPISTNIEFTEELEDVRIITELLTREVDGNELKNIRKRKLSRLKERLKE